MANLTLVAGKIGLSGSTGGGAAGHRVVLNVARNDVRKTLSPVDLAVFLRFADDVELAEVA